MPALHAIAAGQPQSGQQGQGRIDRQDVVRQLGRNRLEHQPVGHDPGQKVPHGRLATPFPGHRQGGDRQQRGRPQGGQQQGEIGAGFAAMAFLGAEQLGQQVGLDRGADELALRGVADRPGPGRYDHGNQHQPGQRAQALEPGPGAIGDRDRENGQDADHRHHRPLDQDADRLGQPEQHGRAPARPFLALEIEQRQGALRQHDRGQLHGIGLGLMGFVDQQETGGQQGRPVQGGGAPDDPLSEGEDHQDRQDGA